MDQTDRFFQIIPPGVSGEHAVVSEDFVATTAEEWDWVGDLGSNAPKGSCFCVLEAITSDVHVRFRSATGAAGTTTKNGLLIKADQPGRPFYLNPTLHRYIDLYSAGAGTLKLQVASKIGSRDYQ